VTVHGTNSCYHAGCRCEPCREAHKVYEKDRRHRRAHGDTARKPPTLTATRNPKRKLRVDVDRMLELAFRRRVA